MAEAIATFVSALYRLFGSDAASTINPIIAIATINVVRSMSATSYIEKDSTMLVSPYRESPLWIKLIGEAIDQNIVIC